MNEIFSGLTLMKTGQGGCRKHTRESEKQKDISQTHKLTFQSITVTT